MLIWMQIPPEALMEVLGSVERCSPDPRRNTSKKVFEVLRSGDEVDTCLRSVSTICRIHRGSGYKEETEWIQIST